LHQSSEYVGARPFLRTPCASARVPRQGYRVKMVPPASGTAKSGEKGKAAEKMVPPTSGTVTMTYQLVGPRGMQPPGVQSFNSFGTLRSYSGATEGALPALPAKPEYVDRLLASGLVGICQGR
ncbi:MAG: hypothetical protein HW398_1139, partial [Acidobacteria bacterium]|nr:hypothetical protein [Acidobacteriota bacterium]